MLNSLNSSSFSSGAALSLTAKDTALFSNRFDRTPSLETTSFGTRSRLEVGTFDQVFSSSGSVTRQFPDVFRFNLRTRTRIRTYVGNEFTNTRSSNQRMTVDLLNDTNLRRVASMTVDPRGINAINRRLDPGTYRIRISTQTSSRGRYFIDMVRLP